MATPRTISTISRSVTNIERTGFEERSSLRSAPSFATPDISLSVGRTEVLGFVLEMVGDLEVLPDHFLVVQTLNATSVWGSDAGDGSYRGAAHFCSTASEGLGNPKIRLCTLADRASLFLEHAPNDKLPVLEIDVIREECRLLEALGLHMTTFTEHSESRSCAGERTLWCGRLARLCPGSRQTLFWGSCKVYCPK